MRLILFIYSVFGYIAGILYLFYRGFKTRFDIEEIKDRLGFYPLSGLSSSGKRIWIHCASVGEVNVLGAFLKFLKKYYFPNNIVITTMTKSGKENAMKKYPEVRHVYLAPLDVYSSIKNALNRIQPQVLLLIETELWPNLIYLSSKNRIKVFLINGRLSDTAFKWYLTFKFFFKPLLNTIDMIVAQSDENLEKFARITGKRDRIYVGGNLKYDVQMNHHDQAIPDEVASVLSNKSVFVAGSTHAGEDEIIIKYIPRFLKNIPELKFVIAPRHLDRAELIESLLQENNIKFVRRTRMNSTDNSEFNVIILDTIGELSAIYKLATVVFVGGTLVPVGGHNVIEPAILEKPIVFGPYYENFKKECELLLENGGAICIKNGEELFEKTQGLLKNKNLSAEMGKRAGESIRTGSGSAEKTFNLIRNHLDESIKSEIKNK